MVLYLEAYFRLPTVRFPSMGKRNLSECFHNLSSGFGARPHPSNRVPVGMALASGEMLVGQVRDREFGAYDDSVDLLVFR